MKYAVIGDVHANLEALQAVLDECERLGVEKYLCVGDIVGYNANPAECLGMIRQLPLAGIVMGNHDEIVSEDTELIGFVTAPHAAAAIMWARQQLSQEEKEYLANLPLKAQIDEITIVHATLDSPQHWGYIFDKSTAGACFDREFSQVCFFGHSHIPLAFEKFGTIVGGKYEQISMERDHKYLVNVGSVGQPRDGDCRSAFVVYDTNESLITLHRVEYDIKTAQRKIKEKGLPERLATRLEHGQ